MRCSCEFTLMMKHVLSVGGDEWAVVANRSGVGGGLLTGDEYRQIHCACARRIRLCPSRFAARWPSLELGTR